MFLRIDKLLIDLPDKTKFDAPAAMAVQDLLGGKFGEMSTLNNYLHQSVAMRAKKRLGPFYQLVASITAEEIGHVELVGATINALLDDVPTKNKEPDDSPYAFTGTMPTLPAHFQDGGPGHFVGNSGGLPWNGTFVNNSGNLIFDLLHNFFLEAGARSHKARVYSMTSNETARHMIGYLLVRGEVHQAAYGLALEKLTGVSMTKMMPTPNIETSKFEHARPFLAKGEHTKLYTFSPNDYRDMSSLWEGTADWVDGAPLQFVVGHPEGSAAPDGTPNPAGFAPDYDPEMIFDLAKRLTRNM